MFSVYMKKTPLTEHFAVCDPQPALPRDSQAHNIGNKLPCLLQLESSLHSVVSFTQTLQCGSSPSCSVEHSIFVNYLEYAI